MLHLYLYATYVTTTNISEKEKGILIDALSFKIPNAEKVRSINMARAREQKNWSDLNYWQLEWTGDRSHYKGGTFPIGFLKIVKMYLWRKNIEYLVTDMRPEMKHLKKELIFTGNLKDFQYDLILNKINEPRGIIEVGTGGGKTIIGIMLIALKRCKTVIIVPTTIVKNQWEERLNEFLPAITCFDYSKKKNLDTEFDVMIVTASTLKSANKGSAKVISTIKRQQSILDHFETSYMILIDEVHEFASDKNIAVANRSKNARYIYGLTATSGKRSDEADINYYGLTGERLLSISQLELVDLEQTVPSNVKFYQMNSIYFDSDSVWLGDDSKKSVQWQYIVINRERNKKIIELAIDRALRKGKPTLIIFDRTDHGLGLLGGIEKVIKRPDLQRMGYTNLTVGFIDGSVDNKARRMIIDRFNSGVTKILIAHVKVIGTGFDSPVIRCIIMGKGGKSEIQIIQTVGRGVRLDDKKESVEIVDFADQGKYVMGHSEERLYTYMEITENIDVSGTYLQNVV